MSENLNQQDAPSLDEVWSPPLRPGDWIHKFPPEATNGKCPNCGEDFDAEEWDERHLHGGASAGETWSYTCPTCNNETISVGT